MGLRFWRKVIRTFRLLELRLRSWRTSLYQESISLILSLYVSPSFFRSRWFLISCKVRYVPSWFPGAGFKNKAKECAKMSEATRRLPWEAVMKSTVSTYPSPCLNCNIISTDHVLGGRHRKAVVLYILSFCTRSSWR